MKKMEKMENIGKKNEDSQEELLEVEEDLSKLKEVLASEKENAQNYLEQIKRLQADFENYRRRIEQEKLFLVENASAVVLEKLLPVLDNFELALTAADKTQDVSTFKDGVKMVYRQMLDLFSELGLTAINAVGSSFDPKMHEAFAYEERDHGQDHEVIQEARKGYTFKGRVLRPALVKVSKTTVNSGG